MNKTINHFLDALIERMTALIAGLVSTRVEGFHAATQAEQQSQLEDLARAISQHDAGSPGDAS